MSWGGVAWRVGPCLRGRRVAMAGLTPQVSGAAGGRAAGEVDSEPTLLWCPEAGGWLNAQL